MFVEEEAGGILGKRCGGGKGNGGSGNGKAGGGGEGVKPGMGGRLINGGGG